MEQSLYFFRGGEKIEIEKEDEYFTAILPDPNIISDLGNAGDIKEIKKVYRDIYKIKTDQPSMDGLMKSIRNDYRQNAVCHHAYRPAGDKITRYYLTDQIMVCFKKGIDIDKREKMVLDAGLKFIRRFGESNVYLFQVTKSAGMNPVKLCMELAAREEIEYAEPNLVNRYKHCYTPKDDLFVNQWHLNSQEDIEIVKNADVGATAAWDITRGSRKVVIAVLDDGFDLTHPDFDGKDKVVYPRDFVDGDSSPMPNKEHDDYHGTPCAGVAIAEETGTGVVGVAPQCAFMPVRFDVVASDDNQLWEIFDYIGKYADVISCSWGFAPVYAPLSAVLNDKLTELARTGGPRGKGCVIVFAAGNYNAPVEDADNKSFKWFDYGYGIRDYTGKIVNGYCTHPDIIVVSASTSQNRKAFYSNWGKQISVCAPSDNWNPMDQQALSPGRGIWTTDNDKFGSDFTANSRYTAKFGGTSSATPLVAGICGLILSANNELTAKQVKEIIESTADKITDSLPDPILNTNKGNYDARGHSEWFGYGKVNAYKAVTKALTTKGAAAPKLPKSISRKSAVVIIAALINPKGKESGNEPVTIMNVSDKPVNLGGWSMQAGKNKMEIGDFELVAGSTTILTCEAPFTLPNTGGTIELIDAEGNIIHKVSYTKEAVAKEGWTVTFGAG